MKELISIFRIETNDGEGPFSGSQNCARFLNSHAAPENLVLESGTEINKAQLLKLYKKGYIFGWCSEELYSAFFRQNKKINGEKKCYSMGIKKMRYESDDYYKFSDGQVMFHPDSKKEDITPNIKKMKIQK